MTKGFAFSFPRFWFQAMGFCNSRLACLVIASMFLAPAAGLAQELPFKPGEKLVFDITWMGIKGGEGTLEVKTEEEYKGKKVYLIGITAKSTGWVRSLYPVHDTTLSYFDIAGLFSRRVEISISENRYRKRKVIEYQQEMGKAIYQVDDDPPEEYQIDPNSQDSFSSLYALRAHRKSLNAGQTLEIPIFEDRKKYTLKVKILRKEKLKLDLGAVDTVVVRPQLLTEGIFARRGTLTVWLSDDERLTPVRMSSKVVIGSFMADLREYSGVAIPFSK